jgi:hypothetical protein
MRHKHFWGHHIWHDGGARVALAEAILRTLHRSHLQDYFTPALRTWGWQVLPPIADKPASILPHVHNLHPAYP